MGEGESRLSEVDLSEYLGDCRELVIAEIDRYIPPLRGAEASFYDLMRDYPLRRAKALRPALCVATCRALGGAMEAVLPSAAALELYHNAFLIHDDVEDGSWVRRDEPTLHIKHGVPIAVNVGDGMLALALAPLLENMRLVGLSKALRVLRLVARMARESAEGQALELGWIRERRWDLRDVDYLRMVHKKTSYYSFITPMLIGAVAAGAGEGAQRAIFRLAALMGSAFQIQDDALNLIAEPRAYGKEIGGDLWEGKHTLILLHMMRSASDEERRGAQSILSKDRPEAPETAGHTAEIARAIAELSAAGELSPAARARLDAALAGQPGRRPVRTQADVDRLFRWIEKYASIPYARGVAAQRAEAAGRALDALARWMGPSVHRAVLRALVEFITERDH
ncbi:MAG: polyprenyl synthetase family protein [Minicystis sp.]